MEGGGLSDLLTPQLGPGGALTQCDLARTGAWSQSAATRTAGSCRWKFQSQAAAGTSLKKLPPIPGHVLCARHTGVQ